jgi:hypothetical protein
MASVGKASRPPMPLTLDPSKSRERVWRGQIPLPRRPLRRSCFRQSVWHGAYRVGSELREGNWWGRGMVGRAWSHSKESTGAHHHCDYGSKSWGIRLAFHLGSGGNLSKTRSRGDNPGGR